MSWSWLSLHGAWVLVFALCIFHRSFYSLLLLSWFCPKLFSCLHFTTKCPTGKGFRVTSERFCFVLFCRNFKGIRHVARTSDVVFFETNKRTEMQTKWDDHLHSCRMSALIISWSVCIGQGGVPQATWWYMLLSPFTNRQVRSTVLKIVWWVSNANAYCYSSIGSVGFLISDFLFYLNR